MDSEKYRPRAIDLFSGAGGLTEGLKAAGFRVVGAVEIDEVARETYTLNHREVDHLWSDVREVSGQEIMDAIGIKPGELELLAGCPPCQGFSRIRTRNTATSVEDPRNDLVFRFLELVAELEPKAVMMENVPGLASDARMERFMRELAALGYYAEGGALKVLNVADFGVPQRRRRMLLMTARGHAVPFAEPAEEAVTVRETIGDLPPPLSSGDALHDLGERRSKRVQDLMARIPRDGGSRSALSSDEQLACHKSFGGFSDVYGRMSWGDVAPTITAGCYHPSKGRFLHPEQNRTITLREAALLQGFPPDYQFSLRRGKIFAASMIGNALPPPFVAKHAAKIRQTLEGGSSA